MNYVRTDNFTQSAAGSYLQYNRGLYTSVLGTVPNTTYINANYFRDVVFSIPTVNNNLTAGTIGSAQTICYGITPAALTQLSAPENGTGTYAFQWQSSTDNVSWSDIAGASQQDYAPAALTTTTYFRRTVNSGNYLSVNSASVQITVSPLISLAQLRDNMYIANNTSTYFNINITGGTTPYTINYTINGQPQATLNNYLRGSSIATGVLTTGNYQIALTSVNDAIGCAAQNLGTSININVSDTNGIVLHSNKALVLVDTASSNYLYFSSYIKPYLENFGIPYDLAYAGTELPDFNTYAIIILGHNNVFGSDYPIAQLEQAVTNGVGLYSFDAHLFDYASNFNTMTLERAVYSTQINIDNTSHYITQYHVPDYYNPSNDTLNLRNGFSVTQNSQLTGGTVLASLHSNDSTVTLLEISTYNSGRIVRWNSYEWIDDGTLGQIGGMDDLIWRSMVWAARKPFVMQGMPPMVTMRVDDVRGTGEGILNNFRWIQICNEFGIIPWCGTFNGDIPTSYIPTFKSLLDNNLATAFPHGFGDGRFIYFNHQNLSDWNAEATVQEAWDFYIQNGLKLSKYLVPHYYEMASAALPIVRSMGCEFLAIHMMPDNSYYSNAGWIHCGPYRLDRDGPITHPRPVYYAGNVNLSGINFFNCLTEIRDDGGYEWFPDNNVYNTAARGIRHLRRALNSMALPSLFTHEIYYETISETNFREILRQITVSVSAYNPEYTSTDYAVQYIRAKSNIRITNVNETRSNVEITFNGSNDMDTKCMLFTEQNGQITNRYVVLPQVNGSYIVTVIK
jgi:hypothetical protein